MSKTFVPLFMIIPLLILSGCTSTVRGVNYELYKGRLQAQTYLTGRAYKPIPMMVNRKNRQARKRIYQASNKRKHYQIAKNRAKKATIRRAVINPKKARRKPPVKIGKAYKARNLRKARTIYQRPILHRAKKIQPRRRITIAYQRPLVKKPVRRAPPRKARAIYTYKRPVVRKPYVAPRRRAVIQRPIVRRPYVAPRKRAVVAQPRPVVPQIPVEELNDRLFSAAKAGNIAQINALLNQGAQVSSSNMSRETPLHAAATLGRSAAVNLLLQKGANPNATTTGGWTPLHSAARFKHTHIAKLLVTRGAQVNARNNQAKTPVALATQVGATATATVLMALGGR